MDTYCSNRGFWAFVCLQRTSFFVELRGADESTSSRSDSTGGRGGVEEWGSGGVEEWGSGVEG